MNRARSEARERGLQIRRLFELSTLLVEDRPLPDLLALIVTTLADVLGAHQVALLLPTDGHLDVVACAGAPLSAEDRLRLQPAPGQLSGLDTFASGQRQEAPARRSGAARAGGERPTSRHARRSAGLTISDQQREPLLLFANQIALAVDRAQLREQALRAQLIEEVEHIARTLVAAVSHDLRGPLSSIKASSSILADPQLNARARPRRAARTRRSHRHAVRSTCRPGHQRARHEPSAGRRAEATDERHQRGRSRRHRRGRPARRLPCPSHRSSRCPPTCHPSTSTRCSSAGC